MYDYLLLAFTNLRRRKLRSWLTMIGIFIGISAVVALISLGQGLENAINEQFESLGSDIIFVEERGLQGPPGSGTSQFTKLTTRDIDVIKKVNGVQNAAGLLVKTGKIESKDEIQFTFVWGIPLDEDEKGIVNFFDVEEGRDLKEGDRRKAIVGVRYPDAKVFTKSIGIGDRITIEGVSFDIVGRFERIGNPFDDSAIMIPQEQMKEIYNIQEELSMIHIQVEDQAQIELVKTRVERELRRFRSEKEGKETFQLRTSEQYLQSFSNVLDIVQAVLVGIAGISLLVGGIGIMNTMYTSVVERTKEIGIMKAIGARNEDILYIFLFEAGLLGLVGGLIGVIIGFGLSKGAEYIATISLGTNLLQASVDIWLVLGALLFSFVVGIASGVLPAYQASKLKPVDALRYE
jgi:putative ABC transport system permease protein